MSTAQSARDQSASQDQERLESGIRGSRLTLSVKIGMSWHRLFLLIATIVHCKHLLACTRSLHLLGSLCFPLLHSLFFSFPFFFLPQLSELEGKGLS